MIYILFQRRGDEDSTARAVFSTKEKAERFGEVQRLSFYIEALRFDPEPLPAGHKRWAVWISEHGIIQDSDDISDDWSEVGNTDEAHFVLSLNGVHLRVIHVSETRAEALSVAARELRAYKSSHKWPSVEEFQKNRKKFDDRLR